MRSWLVLILGLLLLFPLIEAYSVNTSAIVAAMQSFTLSAASPNSLLLALGLAPASAGSQSFTISNKIYRARVQIPPANSATASQSSSASAGARGNSSIYEQTTFTRAEFFKYFGPESSFKFNDIGNNGYIPNPSLYGQTGQGSKPAYVYRVYLSCDHVLNRKEKIPTDTGYRNYVCKNRRQQQCYGDGSYDSYYIEYCE